VNAETDLEKRIARLPTGPGVYLHKDEKGTIIYVGKAKNLRSRVRAYFQQTRPVDAKTKALMKKIADVDVIVTDTETEALILENTLIKEHRPKYNVLLKDDKSYPYIRITKEEYPRVFKTRRVIRDGSRYYGPYTDGTYLFYLLKTLRLIFPLRSCELPLTDQSIAAGKYRVCLDYHIKKCEGPCQGFVSREIYNDYIRQVHQILIGRTKELERSLEQRMSELAEALRFEDALVVRSRLEKLREYTSRQKVAMADEVDRDVFAVTRSGDVVCIVVLTIRDGNLVGKRHFFVYHATDIPDAELLQTTIEQWYVEQDQVPEEILLPTDVVDTDILTSFLQARRGRTVALVVPKIGDKRKLVGMAESNADVLLREFLAQQALKDQSVSRAVLALQQDLRLPRLPRRIECFDNSHMQGTDYVSSMVVFIDGKPKKSEYRRYKLEEVQGNDDFEAMREVLRRRFTKLEDVDENRPDLVIIDGGKGQLSAAMEVLRTLGRDKDFTVIGLAKRLEEVFFPDTSEPTFIPRASSGLRLLQQARDEAHRFAITYHRTLRSKRTFRTELTDIPGIGEATARKLLVALGSVDAVKEATLEALAAVVGNANAQRIRTWVESVAPLPPDTTDDVPPISGSTDPT